VDEHNFWYYLLTGAQNIVQVISGRLPLYSYLGLGPFMYNSLAVTGTVIVYFLGSFVNLCWLFLFLAIIITSESARGLMAAYRQLAKMIPFAG